MPIIRATAILNKRTLKPEDAARNVWHFDCIDTDANTLGAIAAGVTVFYSNIASYLSQSLNPATNAMRLDMAEVDPNGPGAGDDQVSKLLGSTSFTVGVSSAGSASPAQAAVKLTFAGLLTGVPEELGVTRPASRRRGGIYLGPLGVSAFTTEGTPNYEVRVSDLFAEAILDAYDLAHAQWDLVEGEVVHGVYSRSDGVLYPTREVRVDESPDVIRRRKVRAGTRFTRPVDPSTPGVARTGVEAPIPIP
jgi:hypothetical protein